LLGKSVLDGDVFSLDPSKFAHLLTERLHADRASGSSAGIKETCAEDFSGLLRLHWKAKRKEHSAKGEAEDDFANY
jgi:hypothetical protein